MLFKIIRGLLRAEKPLVNYTHRVGHRPRWLHGQPLRTYNIQTFIDDGKPVIRYWDALREECVDSIDQLSELTERQKEIYGVYTLEIDF